MDNDSVVSETFGEECSFLAMEHNDFMDLDPVEVQQYSELARHSSALVDVVTGSLSLSNCVSVSTDGPVLTTSENNILQSVQPVFVNRTTVISKATSLPSIIPSSRPTPGPLAVISMGSWMPDCCECMPSSPGPLAFSSMYSNVSETTGLPSSFVPFLPTRLSTMNTAAVLSAPPSSNTAGKSPTATAGFAPLLTNWLTTPDEEQCRTPVAAATAAATVPGAPAAPRLMRAANSNSYRADDLSKALHLQQQVAPLHSTLS